MTSRIQVFPLPPPAVFGGIYRLTEEEKREMKDLERKLGILTLTEDSAWHSPELFATLKAKINKIEK